MKYNRFSRRRKNYLFGLSDYYKSRKKSTKKQDYMVNTGRSKMLDSFYFENQVWGALIKAWKGYVIAKNKDEYDKMLHYADIIQECQNDLRLKVSSFPDIGKSTLAFYSLRAAQHRENMTNKNNNNNYNSNNQEQVSEVDQQYEQERFTDTYREDFTDDYH
jgi:dsDNA-binding SOS-regulon protein